MLVILHQLLPPPFVCFALDTKEAYCEHNTLIMMHNNMTMERMIVVPLHSCTDAIVKLMDATTSSCVEVVRAQDNQGSVCLRLRRKSLPFGAAKSLLDLAENILYSQCGAGPFHLCVTIPMKNSVADSIVPSTMALQTIINEICCSELRRSEKIEVLSLSSPHSSPSPHSRISEPIIGATIITFVLRGLKGSELPKRIEAILELVQRCVTQQMPLSVFPPSTKLPSPPAQFFAHSYLKKQID
jgi:hypothetical protein